MAKTEAKILIVDDEVDVLTAARIFLKQHFTVVRTEPDPARIPAILQAERFDLVLLDLNYTAGATSSREGFHWLRQIRESAPGVAVVMITAFGDIELAVRAVKEGATDFVTKPWQNEKLLATVRAACSNRARAPEEGSFKFPPGDFIGQSLAMQKVFQVIEKVAATDASVLILGENGTGKELVARALHRQSARAGGNFVNVDLGAVSASLFESELFGHARGAFTDAKEDRAGRFETASGGTLFLDEIGNLPLPLQAKLLTVIQNRQVTRLGTNRALPIDIRLISATNQPLYQMVYEGRFRQDLLYRINTVEIQLPPLRERGADIKLLTDHYLAHFKAKYRKPNLGISEATYRKLSDYEWPGNIRELNHAVERAVILCDQDELQPADFAFSPAPMAYATASGPATSPNLEAAPQNLEQTLVSWERTMVEKALQKHKGNITHAAQELGITRTALYRRIEKYGL